MSTILFWLFLLFVALPIGSVAFWLLTELLFGESETPQEKTKRERQERKEKQFHAWAAKQREKTDWAACPPFPQELRDDP